jgi:outer membrane protein TolC
MIGMLFCIHPFYSYAGTLQQAMETVTKQHPMLQMAEKNIESARGNLTEQSSYAYNPELSLEPQRRRLNGGGTSNDYYITLSQGIELGGKQGLREQSAQASLNIALQNREATKQRLLIETSRAYITLYFAGQLYDLRSQQSDVLDKVSHAVTRQLQLGESSQLDANLAQSAYASALNAATVAKQRLTKSKQRYLIALGKVSDSSVTALELPELSLNWKPPADAYNVALESRPDFLVLQSKLDQSNAQADLASATRIPDVTLNAMIAREAGEKLVLLGLTIPFPVLNSHKGAYRAALAEKERVNMGLVWSKQQLRYEVQSALDNYYNAIQALSNMMKSGMQKNAESTIALAQKSYDAGELDLEALVIHINQGLNAQITALEMIKQAWMARIRLAEVLGHPEYILKGTQT